MSKHNNPSISERARRIFNTQLNQEISNEVLDYITPVVNITPKCDIVRSNVQTATLYVTPTDKDFYLTSAYCEAGFSGNGQSTTFISLVINGVTQKIVQLKVTNLATTTANDSVSVNPIFPVKVDRGTNIELNVSNWGAGGIIGYTEEVKNPSLS